MKRIHFRRNLTKIKPVVEIYPINERIRVPELRVIDENGQMIGVIPTFEALQLARQKETDLVCVSPKAQPPVAKLIDYGTFKYHQEKAIRKQKAASKAVELKEIRLSARIGKHDLDIRLKQAEKFINRGDKVNLEILLKGREKQHPEVGREIMQTFIQELQLLTPIRLDQEIKKMGSKFTAIIMPGEKQPQA